MADLSWKEAILRVLSATGQATHYKDIAEQIAKLGLRKNLGATPSNTVSTIIHNSLNNDEPAIFVKTSPGYYMLSSTAKSDDSPSTAVAKVVEDIHEKDETRPVVKCVGMYWNAARINWKSNPKILGQQQQGSKEIDFSEQVGVYLLYDRSRVIYVGRSVERPLGQRLFEHTRDRLNGRWDRFSWFGLRGVDDSGKLTNASFDATQEQIISLMEAILIEALEPPQNRKRGDDFSSIEYLQVPDKEKSTKKKQDLLKMMMAEIESDE